MRLLQEQDVTFSIKVEQDDIPVGEDALASGDDEEDTKCENEILARLDNGDVWAWAYVVVTAHWISSSGCSYEGQNSLGTCSFKNEEEFKIDYWEYMKKNALEDLNNQMQKIAQDVAELSGE